jgi:hypothetical protein
MPLAFLVKVKIRLAFIFSLEKMSVWIRIAETQHMSSQLLRENFMRDMFVGNVACMPEGIP